MRVRNNLSSLTAGRYLNLNQSGISRALERLSSGLRINRAGDDAAGLAVSEKLRAQISGLSVDSENAQGGVSIVQTADQALQQVQAMVRRMRDLSLTCANGTLTDGDREHHQNEVDSLLTEINRINNTTEYNSMRILGGRIGANAQEATDDRDILDEHSIRATDDLMTSGVYDVEVLSVPEKAMARLEGKVFTLTDPPLGITDAGGFYQFAGAQNDGKIVIKVEVDGKISFIELDAKENAGDSMSEVLGKINRTLIEDGIDVTASFRAPREDVEVRFDTSGVLPEPVDTTVPLAWQNPDPTNWSRSGVKIYDPGGATVIDNLITIDFTSSTNFTVTGDRTGALGTGTTGTNFTGGGISFKIQPDANLSGGDKIELTSLSRTSSINAPNTTALAGVRFGTDSTIGDGNNTVFIDGPANAVTGWDFSGVRGTAVVTGVDTTGIVTPPATIWSRYPTIRAGGDTITNERFTLKLTTDAPDNKDVWSVTGSVSGVHNSLIAGFDYTSNEGSLGGGARLFMKIARHNDYQLGDEIIIDTALNTPIMAWDQVPTEESNDTLVTETFTLQLTEDRNGADYWSVTGSVSGSHSPLYRVEVHNPYVTTEGSLGGGAGLSFDLSDHPNYAVGDVITIDTLFWRKAYLNVDSTPTDVDRNGWFTVTDDTGSEVDIQFTGLCNKGTSTFNLGTSVAVDATHPPDSIFDVDPFMQTGSTTLLSQGYTLTLITDNDGTGNRGPDVWSVVGSESGVHNNAASGTPYVSNSGTIGGGDGLSFTISDDSKFQVGSQILVEVDTRPAIILTSNNAGSKYDIKLEVVADEVSSSVDARSSHLVHDGFNPAHEFDTSTVIYNVDGNPFSDLGFGTGTIVLTDKLGNTYNLSISTGDTIQDLLDSIDACSLDLTATFDAIEKKITIQDDSGGSGTLKVEDVGNAILAENLGIRTEVTGDTLTGHAISRVSDAIIQITDPDGNTARVSNAWGSRDSSFASTGNTGFSVTSSSAENSGGIAGISFALKEKALKTGDTFAIQAGKGRLKLQVGQAEGDDARAHIDIGDVSTSSLGLLAEYMSLSSQEDATALVDSGRLDEALNFLSKLRGDLGGFQNGLQYTIKNLDMTRENLQAAESRIRDADMAEQQMEFVRRQIMQQMGIAMSSQANSLAENVLTLLQ